MEKKYQIFISSTYKDLIEARSKVRDAILSMMHFPVGMEMFNAADEEQWEIIQETIDSSDYYVLILGQRYGRCCSRKGRPSYVLTLAIRNVLSTCSLVHVLLRFKGFIPTVTPAPVLCLLAEPGYR